jgi:hypothetical protein
VVNSLVSLRARRLAVAELQKTGMDRAEAWRRINSIPESAVAQAVIEAGVPKDVYGAFGDGTILRRIIEWLSDPANQEKLKAIVEFLMKMALLFAHSDHQPFGEIDDVGHPWNRDRPDRRSVHVLLLFPGCVSEREKQQVTT